MLTFDDITDLVETADRLRVSPPRRSEKLLNRRQFMDLLTTEFGRSQRHGRPLSVLMIDADDFKQINDRYGHSAGDDVLRAMAGRSWRRPQGRPGGTPGRRGIRHRACRHRHAGSPRTAEGCVAASPANRAVDGDRLQVTVSIGVAARRVQHTDPSDLLRFADRALYAAKATAGSRRR